MRYTFLSNHCGDMSFGSYRIYCEYLSKLLLSLPDVEMTAIEQDNPLESDILIFHKDYDVVRAANIILAARRRKPTTRVGWIHPPPSVQTSVTASWDFIIVGSPEEADFYAHHERPILRFPQIEPIPSHVTRKKHNCNKRVVLGYHGNIQHLQEFEPHVNDGIDIAQHRLKNRELILRVIASDAHRQWKGRKPSCKIEYVPWTHDTFIEQASQCDIGIVPGTMAVKDNPLSVSRQHKQTANDLCLLMKLSSNAGRAAVFHQVGVPVIADFIPSCFHVMGDGLAGQLAHRASTWAQAIELYARDANLRARHANLAYARFNNLYDPMEWAERLHEDIKCLL